MHHHTSPQAAPLTHAPPSHMHPPQTTPTHLGCSVFVSKHISITQHRHDMSAIVAHATCTHRCTHTYGFATGCSCACDCVKYKHITSRIALLCMTCGEKVGGWVFMHTHLVYIHHGSVLLYPPHHNNCTNTYRNNIAPITCAAKSTFCTASTQCSTPRNLPCSTHCL